jgi:uncharacterized GH25 family protein
MNQSNPKDHAMISWKRWVSVSVAATVLGIACLQHVRAHEIKVMLDRLNVKKGEKDAVFLSWGHLLPTEGPIRGEDVEGYQLLTPNGSVQFLATDKESDQRNVVHLEDEGLYTAAAIRKPSVLTVFTLGDQHVHFLGPKTEVREGGNIEDSFRSFQFAKALVTAGNASETPKPIGHALEIVPTSPPETWTVGRDISFQVLFEGKPIFGKLFQAKPLDFKPDDVWTWTRPTDQRGQAVLRPDRPGTWLLKASFDRPAAPEDQKRYDKDHWTATLILEIHEAK